MENLTQFVGNYWPYLLGLLFLGIMAVNFRSWLVGRRTEG